MKIRINSTVDGDSFTFCEIVNGLDSTIVSEKYKTSSRATKEAINWAYDKKVKIEYLTGPGVNEYLARKAGIVVKSNVKRRV